MISNKPPLSYADAGVDIDAGNQLVNAIKPLIAATQRPGADGSIGGFGGVFDIAATGYKDPLLVAANDGVGTKLKIAIDTGIHDSIGIDLVAMCVNDLIVQGAEPLFFLDYFATGKLDNGVAEQVITGIAKGCEIAGCALTGGETAEMPGMYGEGDYDLAGFSVGAVERGQLLPKNVKAGDVLLGLASSGVHSNGYSLVRRIVERSGLGWDSPSPFSEGTLGEALIEPTRIYVKSLLAALTEHSSINGFAHITGGGLTENLPRVLPEDVDAEIDLSTLAPSGVFSWLKTEGGVEEAEMLRTFNCGIGMVVIVDQDAVGAVTKTLQDEGETVFQIGHLKQGSGQVEFSRQPQLECIMAKLKVAVLISGRGSNMGALARAAIDPSYPAEIVMVLSNRPHAPGLELAREHGIRIRVVDHTEHSSPDEHQKALHEALIDSGAQLVCLAGYMRILGDWFINQWRGNIINIHPSLLPSFRGLGTHERALERGVRIHGASVHYVNTELDGGPIIAQAAVPVRLDDTAETLGARVLEAEHKLYPKALALIAARKVRWSRSDVVFDDDVDQDEISFFCGE